MASPSSRRDLKALKRLVNQADLVSATIPDPHPSIASARESLNAAILLAADMVTVNPAVALGAKGGTKTAERGPEYFKRFLLCGRQTQADDPQKAVSYCGLLSALAERYGCN